MKVVSYPENFVEDILSKFRHIINSGQVAEGKYYNAEDDYIIGKKSVPVNSCGAALFSLLAYQKFQMGKTKIILQSNTMRGLYTLSRLLDFEVIVSDCSIKPGFLAMDPNSYSSILSNLENSNDIDKAVTIYSLIGGFFCNAYSEIEDISRNNDIPLIIDMAHGHYLDSITMSDYSHLAFSFYGTKILPAGEGGLISTVDIEMFNWIKRFLIYDRFDYELQYGLNLRANELTACIMHELMTQNKWKPFFKDIRVSIAKKYKKICIEHNINFLDFEDALDYNAYKFIVFDRYDDVLKKNTLLTKHNPTSPVFAEHLLNKKKILEHWCPPTYPDLYDSILS